jgi:hypothetical protein
MIGLIDRALALNPSFARGWHISGLLRLCDQARGLRPNDPVERDAVCFHWETGERDLDLKKLFYKFVQPQVIAAARSQTPPQVQSPIAENHGKAGSDQFWPR